MSSVKFARNVRLLPFDNYLLVKEQLPLITLNLTPIDT